MRTQAIVPTRRGLFFLVEYVFVTTELATDASVAIQTGGPEAAALVSCPTGTVIGSDSRPVRYIIPAIQPERESGANAALWRSDFSRVSALRCQQR